MRVSIPPWRARELIEQNRVHMADAFLRGLPPRVIQTPTGWVRLFAGDCEAPVTVVTFCAAGWGMRTPRTAHGLFWLPDFFDGVLEPHWASPEGGKWHDNPLEEDFLQATRVRCRVCPLCLRQRSSEWTERGIAEIFKAKRTWLVTLTYREKILQQWLRDGLDEEFTAGQYLTRYLKRVRKHGYVIRYLAALEYGEAKGRIHHHMLIHCGPELKARDLRHIWSKGHIHARLVKERSLLSAARAAEYVAKYITKSKTSRIRASSRYGKTSLGHSENVKPTQT